MRLWARKVCLFAELKIGVWLNGVHRCSVVVERLAVADQAICVLRLDQPEGYCVGWESIVRIKAVDEL